MFCKVIFWCYEHDTEQMESVNNIDSIERHINRIVQFKIPGTPRHAE